jgi:hypothetical protein
MNAVINIVRTNQEIAQQKGGGRPECPAYTRLFLRPLEPNSAKSPTTHRDISHVTCHVTWHGHGPWPMGIQADSYSPRRPASIPAFHTDSSHYTYDIPEVESPKATA